MSKIRLGVLGGGGDSLIGVLHRVASHMFDRYEITGGVFNPDFEENIKFAKHIGVNTDRVYLDFDAFIEEESKRYKDAEQYKQWISGQPQQLDQFKMIVLERQLVEKLENVLKSKKKVIKFSELANKQV